VNGTVNGCRVRVTIALGDGGWAFPLSPSRMRDQGFEVGAEVMCELAPEGPQRGELADDIAAALEANPAAGAFFDTLAQFYRKAYLRYIDATTRRPGVRAARIAEVTALCASGVKERPRSLGRSRDFHKPLLPLGFQSTVHSCRTLFEFTWRPDIFAPNEPFHLSGRCAKCRAEHHWVYIPALFAVMYTQS
jgi:hypothetical protein